MNSSPRNLAPWAWPTGVALLCGVSGWALWKVFDSGDPHFLLGLLPAVVLLAAVLVLGLRRLPRWATLTAGLLLLAGGMAFTLVGLALAYGWFAASLSGNALFGVGAGMATSAGCAVFFLAGGWVYADARQRGLNAALWAAITLIIFPYLLGFIAYVFVVVIRDQRLNPCGSCGARLVPTLTYCTHCGTKVQCVCAACGARSSADAAFCGHCGKAASA